MKAFHLTARQIALLATIRRGPMPWSNGSAQALTQRGLVKRVPFGIGYKFVITALGEQFLDASPQTPSTPSAE